jgi:Rieske Fe-S protein
MPEDEDKYPSESGRRRFVKGVVGSAALASVGTGTAASLNAATSPTGAGGGPTQYIGIENTDGPAPRGMPIVPIEIENGELKGLWPEVETQTVSGRQVMIAETDVGGITYSSAWFQYCGVQTYEGAQPDADQDNFFRAAAGSPYEWQDQEPGTKLTVDMFDDYEEWGNGIGKSGLGKPAMASWRSQGDVKTMPVQVLRSPEVPKMANGEGKYSELPGPVQSFISAATADGFMAWLDKCTHFCCVPGFKAFAGSAKFGGENSVYCQCHQSLYDPFSPVQKQFIALPRPNE